MLVVRRRFQDFSFLHDHLAKSFPACVVPPIPEKHRLGQSLALPGRDCETLMDPEYIKGDRFSPEFVEKRRLE